MYQIVHGAAGLLIGSQTGNPWLAFILGVLSHIVLDAIPHDVIELKKWRDRGNYTKKLALEASVDMLFFVLLLYILWQNNVLNINLSIIAGIIGAVGPDYVWGVRLVFKIEGGWLQKYKELHEKVHSCFYKNIHLPLKYALIIQLSFLIIILYLYYWLLP